MNWHDRIARAERAGGFSIDDRALAESWVTCACGEQDPRIPRCEEDGFAPVDEKLRCLGLMFADDVGHRNIERARRTLLLIDKRADEILKALP